MRKAFPCFLPTVAFLCSCTAIYGNPGPKHRDGDAGDDSLAGEEIGAEPIDTQTDKDLPTEVVDGIDVMDGIDVLDLLHDDMLDLPEAENEMASSCGDGHVNGSEECDDGNGTDKNRCDNDYT